MVRITEIRKIALIGDYLPRKCGIATFTSDLCRAVAGQYSSVDCTVGAVNDVAEGYDYPPEVCFEFSQQDLDSYRRAADFLNFSNADVVCLQHEYGLYGGPAGRYILALLRDLRMPIVTTLHTVLRDPSADHRRVMLGLADLSSRLVVMSQRGRAFLMDVYGVPDQKIDVVAHGIPDMPFVDPNSRKDQFGVAGKHVVLTFGLLSPNKGIEYALRALPEVIREFPNLIYIVLGATHPNLVREQGESYRLSLERLVGDLGIGKHVVFYDRFVELDELIEFIAAADVYLTPYLEPAQITSGTLAYAFGCGKAVISTPYWHAEELLAEGRGMLVPFRDSAAIARELCNLLRDEPERQAMCKRAYKLGREMIWSHTGHLYMDSFQRARRSRIDAPIKPLAIQTLEERHWELPKWRLDHLMRMTDSTGLLQHARFTLPNYADGYCTDDNARALLFAMYLEEMGLDTPETRRASTRYAALLNAAFDSQRRRFRNFLGFDRHWLDEEAAGSDDCFGRAVYALGACIGRSKQRTLQSWAMEPFHGALMNSSELTSPRAWAGTLIGIHEYLRRLSGDRLVNEVRDTLTNRLIDLYQDTATDDWPWFEDTLSYDNARLSQALILSGYWTSNAKATEIGLRSLGWLSELQRSPRGHFRPIGSNGFYRRGEQRADFDQQPIEALAMVSACAEAYRTTEDSGWLNEARLAFEWFLGRNDLGLELYDASTGGCHDGLHEDRVNENQGAESTLAFLLSLAELKQLESSMGAFRRAAQMAADGRG
ncbi:MAG TPA: glycosyltransferase family 4 protein [Thermoguttaceae bacterium]|nr:glycosyltransferase family 4 protein [Thermoguttaceae bacterium]